MKPGKTFRIALSAVLALCLSAASANAFSWHWGNPGTYETFDPCAGPQTPGGTWLDPIAYHVECAQWYITALEWQFSGPNRYTKKGTEFRPEAERWSFAKGDPLDGDLYIDIYSAYDDHHTFDAKGNVVLDSDGPYCRHGAHLSASYVLGPSDPANLDWVQVFVASYDKHGVPARTPIADPFYNDGTDDAPYYFNEADSPYDFYDGSNWPLWPDLIFGDTPGASHLEQLPFSVDVDFYLFLASEDPANPRQVTIHDGIAWGYKGVCVPEPATWILLTAGTSALLMVRRRRNCRARER